MLSVPRDQMSEYCEMLCGLLSIPQNIDMDANKVMPQVTECSFFLKWNQLAMFLIWKSQFASSKSVLKERKNSTAFSFIACTFKAEDFTSMASRFPLCLYIEFYIYLLMDKGQHYINQHEGANLWMTYWHKPIGVMFGERFELLPSEEGFLILIWYKHIEGGFAS